MDEVAAVVANARAWIGNDSGLAHLAQAYGVAGVVAFGGGGGWPVYGVWGAGSAGLVCELACFGCEWACAFEEAYCLREVPVREVASALHDVIHHPTGSARVRRLSAANDLSPHVLGGAARKHRGLRAELAHRMDAIVELEHGQVVGLKHALAESREAMNTLPALRDEADSMRLAAQQRLELLVQSHRENDALRVAGEGLQSQLHALRREADRLRQAAAERLGLLDQAQQEIEQLRQTAGARLLRLTEAHEEMEAIRQVADERLRAMGAQAVEAEPNREAMTTIEDSEQTQQG